jgi:DNA-binding NtrC family response regulator
MKFSCILSLAIAGQTISACQLVNAKATDSETDNSPRISIQEITVKAYPLTGTISSAALSLPLAKTDSAELLKKLPLQDRPPSVRRLQWEYIQRVLNANGGNISATARSLGMHRRTLQRKLQKRPVKQ